MFHIIDAKGQMRSGDLTEELVVLAGDVDIFQLDLDLDLDLDQVGHIAIDFPNFADGRGFSIARALRQSGYQGHLTARGHLTPDQFRHAMACGFDDIAVPPDLANRYGTASWREVAASPLPNYQARLQNA